MEAKYAPFLEPQSINFSRSGGLIPAIIQDADSLQVLMQGWMNLEALEITMKTKKVTFYSRSRNRLWTKGETSGNTLHLQAVMTDCDHDSLLILARCSGVVCHTGSRSCYAGSPENSLAVMAQLQEVLSLRMKSKDEKSYTVRLLQGGSKRIAKKVGEEAAEVLLEAENGSDERLAEETADLLYHLSVLLLSRDMGWDPVMKVLKDRML